MISPLGSGSSSAPSPQNEAVPSPRLLTTGPASVPALTDEQRLSETRSGNPPLRARISAAVDRAFSAFATMASSSSVHLTGMAALGLATMPGSLLTGMVAYAALLHARIPLMTLQTLADRILASDAGGTRLMLGILLSGWALLKPLLGGSTSVSLLSGPAHALFGLIPMLVGCLLARLAMEEHAVALPPSTAQL